MASYVDKLAGDLKRWQDNGMIDADTAKRMLADAQAHSGRGIGFGQVLAILAGILLAAALLITVAANWEAVPRLWRVGLLFSVIAIGYVGGAMLKLRDLDGPAEASWLVAAAAFGGSIALIGQMYHLTGDEAQAILVWAIGTAVAAGLLRSTSLTAAAVALATVWTLWSPENFRFSVNPWFLVIMAALWGLSIWTRSIPARHLIVLSLIPYLLALFLAQDGFLFIKDPALIFAVVLAVGSATLFIAVAYWPDEIERLTGLGEGLAVDALLGLGAAMLMLQISAVNAQTFAWISALSLAAVVGAVVIGGHMGRAVRWLAYLGFAVQVGAIYTNMIGSMLGTAGFFLLAAIGIGLLAFVIIRLERRAAAQSADKSAGALS